MSDPIDPLRVLFAQKRNMRTVFDAQKEEEWKRLSENIEDEISRLIVATNPKTSHLGRAMGTSDYRTAKARKDRAFAEVYPDLDNPSTETVYVWSSVSPGNWKVTDAAGRSATLAVIEDEGAVVALSGDAEVVKPFVDDPEGGYLLWQKATAGK